MRVLLIGGTSNVGKSTVARALADRLGFSYESTDRLGRHPGRPWGTPDWEVPPHVVEHYRTHTVDELTAAQLEHYERMWPRVEELVTAYAGGRGTGLLLEGSGVWPDRVAELTVPHTAAVFLTAADEVVRARVRGAGRYADATGDERHLLEKFLGRSTRYQELMIRSVDRLGLVRVAVDGHPVEALGDTILAVATAPAARPVRDR